LYWGKATFEEIYLPAAIC